MLLNGKWKLYFAPQEEDGPSGGIPDKAGMSLIDATVPGNVELDLSDAGILPKDLFKGMNILEGEKFETFHWLYEKTFTAPDAPAADEKTVLRFRGVDCLAEYFLNGEKIGESDNMFISHEFDVTGKLNYGGENTLTVHISSIATAVEDGLRELNSIDAEWSIPKFMVGIRKAPHMSGWDIMPRAISAGIWRDVELKNEKKYGINYVYVHRESVEGNVTKCRIIFESSLPFKYRLADLKFKITASCKDSRVEQTFIRKGGTGCLDINIPNCYYWWPRPYGDPDMYDINIEVYTTEDEFLFSRSVRRGIRTVELCRSDMVEPGGCFEFHMNGKKVMAIGTNWVPMDAYHSRDKERYAKALELAEDVGCNIIRCWGGNVYEDHEFFDFCDEHGIMVWQDFAMACHFYPQNEKFLAKIRQEAEWVIKEYRCHPSIAVWSGDNEIDSLIVLLGKDPAINRITREVLPAVCERLDPKRPFLPSSPYIPTKAYNTGEYRQGSKFLPEDHLWGPRDYFKSDFYKNSGAYFVSEIGYHGCPSKESIEKFIDSEHVWPYRDNPQWILHSSDQHGRDGRVMLMHDQVAQLFGEVPEDMDDFILASQISQAEAKKFFIEHTRARMERMGGLIWWNLVDGWPQFSDAVVDYYYNKKLAYDYIKRSQQPFIIMLDEMADWGQEVICANSTFKEVSGRVSITDADTGNVVFESEFTAGANCNTTLGKLSLMYSFKGMLFIRWTLSDNTEGFNTYLCGSPAFDLERYKTWLSKMN